MNDPVLFQGNEGIICCVCKWYSQILHVLCPVRFRIEVYNPVLKVDLAPCETQNIASSQSRISGKYDNGLQPFRTARNEPFEFPRFEKSHPLVIDRRHSEEIEGALFDQSPFAFAEGKDSPYEL